MKIDPGNGRRRDAVAVNRVKPVIDKTFDFDSAPRAYEYLKSAQHFGKVVITI